MSIFGDIGGFLKDVAASPIGQGIGAGLARGIQERIAGSPVIVNAAPAGGPPSRVIQGGQSPLMFATPASFQLPQLPMSTPISTGGSVVPVQLDVPQPIPFGIDPQVPSFFRPTQQSARPIRYLTARNPVTGALATWEYAGRPVIYSRDLAVCKRVRKIATRLGSASRKR